MGSLRNNIPSFTSFGPVEEAEISHMAKNGITSILESDDRRTKSTLQKTLSADMSSKRWQAQNGFPSILADENNNKKSLDFSDVLSSILTQKTSMETKSASLPPYIHPPVKTAAHSLSYQSLQICTESLGSETGFNGNKPSSEPSLDAEEDLEEELGQHKQENMTQDFKKEIYHDKYCRRGLRRRTGSQSFPPPIPSLSCRDRGSLHMRKCRNSGRIVLEAISVPSQNNFLAKRQDGCLILSFISKTSSYNEASNDHGEVLKQDKDFTELLDDKELINSVRNDEDFEIRYEEDEEQEEEEEQENHNIYSQNFQDDSCQVEIEADDSKQIQIPQSLLSQPFLTGTISKQETCLTASSYKDEFKLMAESQGISTMANTTIPQSPGHEHCRDKCIVITSPMSIQQKELQSTKQNTPCSLATSLYSCKESKGPPLYSDLKWISIS